MSATRVVTGQACWTVAARAGVTALLIASEPAFLAVKYAGAAYLIYLGLARWRGCATCSGAGLSAARSRPSAAPCS